MEKKKNMVINFEFEDGMKLWCSCTYIYIYIYKGRALILYVDTAVLIKIMVQVGMDVNFRCIIHYIATIPHRDNRF